MTNARNLANRSTDFVSVRDFGARGDGVTDDTAAIQAALTAAAASGATVLFGGLTYNTTAKLTCNCSIDGQGGTINGYIESAASDLLWKDITVVSPQAAYGIYLHGSVGTRYSDIVLDGVNVTFAAGATPAGSRLGLYPTYIDRLTVRNCHIQYGIQMISCANYTVINNWLDGDAFQNDNELIHASINSYGIIANNTFTDSLDNYIDLFSSGDRTIVQGNRFIGCKCKTGAAVEIKVSLTDTSNTSGSGNGWVEQILIDGNYFGDTRAYAAQPTQIITIYYIDSRASPVFSWADTPRNIVISNNIFDGFDATSHGASYFTPVYLYSSNAVLIEGNIFRKMTLGASSSDMSSCVWIEKCQDVVVSGNRISMKDGTGVSLHDACTNITIANNHMLDDLNTSEVLKYGIRIAKEGSRPGPTITNSKFIGNTMKGSIGTFRHLITGSSTMTDCVVSGNFCYEQATFEAPSRCVFTGNHFEATSRPDAAIFGAISAICAHNVLTSNFVKSPSATPKSGFTIYRMRGSTINDNTFYYCTTGLAFAGTNTAGELDYLNIKDNFSVSQTSANFPNYASMNAADTALLQASNNQKIT